MSPLHCAWFAGWALGDHHQLCAHKWPRCHGPGAGPAGGVLLQEASCPLALLWVFQKSPGASANPWWLRGAAGG